MLTRVRFGGTSMFCDALECVKLSETCLGNEMHLHPLYAETLLKIDQVDRVSGQEADLGVDEEGLDR
jgi:hypothetical protein